MANQFTGEDNPYLNATVPSSRTIGLGDIHTGTVFDPLIQYSNKLQSAHADKVKQAKEAALKKKKEDKAEAKKQAKIAASLGLVKSIRDTEEGKAFLGSYFPGNLDAAIQSGVISPGDISNAYAGNQSQLKAEARARKDKIASENRAFARAQAERDRVKAQDLKRVNELVSIYKARGYQIPEEVSNQVANGNPDLARILLEDYKELIKADTSQISPVSGKNKRVFESEYQSKILPAMEATARQMEIQGAGEPGFEEEFKKAAMEASERGITRVPDILKYALDKSTFTDSNGQRAAKVSGNFGQVYAQNEGLQSEGEALMNEIEKMRKEANLVGYLPGIVQPEPTSLEKRVARERIRRRSADIQSGEIPQNQGLIDSVSQSLGTLGDSIQNTFQFNANRQPSIDPGAVSPVEDTGSAYEAFLRRFLE